MRQMLRIQRFGHIRFTKRYVYNSLATLDSRNGMYTMAKANLCSPKGKSLRKCLRNRPKGIFKESSIRESLKDIHDDKILKEFML